MANFIKIINAFNKWGRENFYIQPLAYCENQNLADKTEDWFIKFFDSIKTGYNIRDGGSHGKASPETRKKLSISHLGLNTWSKGKKASSETKQKISNSLKGNSNRKGKKASRETRQNISVARIGNKNRLGISHSQEDRDKISKGVRAVIDAGGGNSKINYEIADVIRNDYLTIKSHRKLAKKYGLGKATIGRVLRNEIWIKK